MILDYKALYDQLRAKATKIHFFGLGFIQVKLNEQERYHFYNPELAAFVPPEEIHDHRYDFISTVMKGVLSQEIYSFTEKSDGDHVLRYVSCDPGHEAPKDKTFVVPELLTKVHSNRGSQYTLSEKALHKVLPVACNTITYLQRGSKIKPFARVISSVKEEVCPFSKNLPEEELWTWVKRIIEE